MKEPLEDAGTPRTVRTAVGLWLAIAVFVLFVTALLATISPIKSLSEVNVNIQQGVTAAERIFGERGYQGTSMDDVAAEVGVSKPLIYQYYGSKDGLFAAALEMPAPMAVLMEDVLAHGEIDDFGERFLQRVLEVWDDERTGGPLVALVRSAMSHPRCWSGRPDEARPALGSRGRRHGVFHQVGEALQVRHFEVGRNVHGPRSRRAQPRPAPTASAR